MLALASKQLDRLPEAEAALQHSVELLPREPGLRFALGEVLRDLGRYSEAGEAFRACIDLDHNHSDAWTALGNLYGDAGHHAEARAPGA